MASLGIELRFILASDLALHPRSHPVDFGRRALRQGALVDERFDQLGAKALEQRPIASDAPSFDQRLTLPELRAFLLMLPERLLAHHQRALVARRAQARVNGIQISLAKLHLHEMQEPLNPLGEVLVTGKLASRSAGRLPVAGAAVDKDQVEIRLVPQLLAAELSHSDHRQSLHARRRARLSVSRPELFAGEPK